MSEEVVETRDEKFVINSVQMPQSLYIKLTVEEIKLINEMKEKMDVMKDVKNFSHFIYLCIVKYIEIFDKDKSEIYKKALIREYKNYSLLFPLDESKEIRFTVARTKTLLFLLKESNVANLLKETKSFNRLLKYIIFSVYKHYCLKDVNNDEDKKKLDTYIDALLDLLTSGSNDQNEESLA